MKRDKRAQPQHIDSQADRSLVWKQEEESLQLVDNDISDTSEHDKRPKV